MFIRAEIMRFNLNHISLDFWYTVFWVHTSEAHGQKAAVTACEQTKFSFTHKFTLKTHTSYKNSQLCLWR